MRKVLSSYILTIISLSLVLFLLGLYLIVASQTNQITNTLKEKINIVIELYENYNDNDKKALLSSLGSNEAVIGSSIQLLTKEEAKQIMIGEDDLIFMDDSLQNPFRDAIVLNLRSDKYESDFLEQFSAVLKSEEIVADVFYQKDLFELINRNLSKVSITFLIIGILMLLLAVSLIYNTVNLSLTTDRQKIQTMELIGAERSYIRKPYLRRALQTGFISFFIAIVLLLAFGMLVYYNFDFIQNAINFYYLGAIIILLLFLGVIIPVLSTNNIVNSHLNRI